MSENLPATAYARAFYESPNPSILTGPNFVISDANEACLEFTGYEPGELVGETPDVLFTDPEQFTDVAETLAAGEPWTGYFELEAKDGRFKYGHGSALPLSIEGEVAGYLGIFVDVTRERRYEQVMQIFSRVFRHNLRNDTSVILGYLDVLREATSDPEVIEAAEYVEERITRLLDRADTARQLESVLAEGGTEITPVTLGPVLEDVVREARERFPRAEFAVVGDPDAVVAADGAVDDVLGAILENAVVHSDRDAPEVEVRVEQHPGQDRVAVSVADDGPGIPPKEVPAAVGDREGNPTEHGTGLDLFFVASMMEEYSGRLAFGANEPRGAVVELWFRRLDPSGDGT